MTNGSENFDAYYGGRDLFGDGDRDEWNAFKSSLMSALPTTFVVCEQYADGSGRVLLAQLEAGLYPELFCLAWYPGRLAWQALKPKSEWSKELKHFLISATNMGIIIRQELVSMIPALLLCSQKCPSPSILDLCAAPGSKTFQLAQSLRQEGGDSTDHGLLVANDMSPMRANLLIGRVKCAGSTALTITQADGSTFQSPVQFDRVLCDVPCSGDGTIRKAMKQYTHWKSSAAAALHLVQLKIAKRAFHMVKPGGFLLYSTCSFNPVENEAVVSELLQTYTGEIEVLDCGHLLPGLTRANGLPNWEVRTKIGESPFATFPSYDSVKATRYHSQTPITVFPPSSPEIQQHLQKCMRFYPHQNNSGGFFVALLQRKVVNAPSPMPVLPTIKPAINKNNPFPFVRLLSSPEGRQLADRLSTSLGLNKDFPLHQICVRQVNESEDQISTGRRSRFYMFSEATIQSMEFFQDNGSLMHAGCRVFETCARPDNVAPSYRICREGLTHVLPYLDSKRLIDISGEGPQLLRLLLENPIMPFHELAESFLTKLKLVAERGNFVFHTKISGQVLYLIARIDKASIQCLNSKLDRAGTLILLDNDQHMISSD